MSTRNDLPDFKQVEKKARQELASAEGFIRHWHLCDLGNAIYEQFRYKEALPYLEESIRIAPKCPMTLWSYAGCLRMLDRDKESEAIYRSLIRRGAVRMEAGRCGEGIRWCRSLVNDCRYMMSLLDTVPPRQKVRWLKLHLKHRGKNTPSIFPRKEVVAELKGLEDVEVS